MKEKPFSSRTLFEWYIENQEKLDEAARTNFEVLKKLLEKPLEEPRSLQTFMCRWCLNPKTEVPFSKNEYIPLRAILMIPDAVLDPPICHECYYAAIGAYNRNVTNVGTSNSGHDNMALRRLL